MVIKKVIEPIVTTVAEIRNGAKIDVQSGGSVEYADNTKALFGDTDQISLAYDPATGSNGALVVYDEANNAEVTRLPTNSTLATLLSSKFENGGSAELDLSGMSGNLATAQDPTSHASSHHDGGADEIDASDLAAAAGTNGQVLTSDGAAATWSAVSSTVVASQTDDLSDVTHEREVADGSISGNSDLVNISGASGILLGGNVKCATGNATGDKAIDITVDGGATQTINWPSNNLGTMVIPLPSIEFSNSLVVTMFSGGTNGDYQGDAWVKQ